MSRTVFGSSPGKTAAWGSPARSSSETTLGDDTVTVSAGEVARFDGAQDISPRAVADSEALLVLAEKA